MNLHQSMSNEIIYLACPYTHKDPYVEEFRVLKVSQMAGWLCQMDYVVFSPLTHSHMIAKLFPETRHNHEFWGKQNRPYIIMCHKMFIYTLEGWDQSLGVSDEIILARDYNKPIFLINHDLQITEYKNGE